MAITLFLAGTRLKLMLWISGHTDRLICSTQTRQVSNPHLLLLKHLCKYRNMRYAALKFKYPSGASTPTKLYAGLLIR
ncbi:hypothetical protein E2C01_000227 [Portunus trituberculatus]|uniref:Secreted protein n=1 Tax=Portunus trituberculatus TaxID=210409 RepID=A0A5B7CDJ7_PORTR|nr:hypothetical protein [Portunus trituberculatus]